MSSHIPLSPYDEHTGDQTSDAGLTEADLLIRQRLAPELALQQWHTQQFMPPPPAPPPAQPQPQSQRSQPVYVPEAAAPKPVARSTRAKAAAAKPTARTTTRRRKASIVAKDESDGSISEEEFTMEGVKTKSGRKVHRPAHFNPAQKTPSRRRGPYRRSHDARICKVCQRGHSPQSNMIVFCDGCNGPFHQLCHDPPIDDLVIQVESAEWYCAACAKSREQKPLQMGLPGTGLTEEEKKLYLASLPMASLMEIILFAEKTHPDLPIYDPRAKELAAAFKANHAVKLDDGTPGVVGEDGITEMEDTGGPNWEEMIIRAITALDVGKGAQPKNIFDWISTNFPALTGRDIRLEAQPSLQSALRKGRLLRDGHSYRINPSFSAPLTPKPPGMLAPGSGIKLPLETEMLGAAYLLVDYDTIAFSHRCNARQQSVDDDLMDGIAFAEQQDPTTTAVQ
ncbi:hypothetical protein BZA05DRAFT_408391 [Tricharina praecox]|uniref:uncharacterized protein n=1 Tax=Tricharina praecox TaxID=43433 RepID=UPI002220BB4A|nr:uncharacterized protein BZA05DRAFT_408391 [Tricharina praecox]KAI5845395.1 hypothetical protein BZA05DRAFT_408391 [Tricharina praecox]